MVEINKKGGNYMKKLSIVVPVYYNEDNLLPLYEDLKSKVLTKIQCEYELIFVDDGSKDNSYDVMCKLAELDKNIKLVKLSRNFGEHAAILAGLANSTGDCAIRKAADLQEPSEIILDMLKKYEQGSKVVLALRKDREEPLVQKMFSSLYAYIMRKFALHNMPKGGFDSFLIDRQIIDILHLMNEKNTSLMGQILWSGFKYEKVYYTRLKREVGKSRWTLSKKIKLVFDSLLGFCYVPIKFISSFGFISFLISIVWLLYILIRKLTGKITVEGYTTVMILMLMGFGIIMLSLGILGEYMWRMFDATRNRPPYVIDEIKKNEE
jgi:dolichol-phosphate mannosyltransferase